MDTPKLARRHIIILGLAAMFALGGVWTASTPSGVPLDRDALARMMNEAAADPSVTGSIP